MPPSFRVLSVFSPNSSFRWCAYLHVIPGLLITSGFTSLSGRFWPRASYEGTYRSPKRPSDMHSLGCWLTNSQAPISIISSYLIQHINHSFSLFPVRMSSDPFGHSYRCWPHGRFPSTLSRLALRRVLSKVEGLSAKRSNLRKSLKQPVRLALHFSHAVARLISAQPWQ